MANLHTAYSNTNWAYSFPGGTHDSGQFTIASDLPTIPANTMRVRALGMTPSDTTNCLTVGSTEYSPNQLYWTGSVIDFEMNNTTTFQLNKDAANVGNTHVYITFDVIGGGSLTVPGLGNTTFTLQDASGSPSPPAETNTPPTSKLKAWWSADNINSGSGQPTDGDPIGTWYDLSASGSGGLNLYNGVSNLTQSTAANQPTYIASIPIKGSATKTEVEGLKLTGNDGGGTDTWMETSGSTWDLPHSTVHMLISTCFSDLDGYPAAYMVPFANGGALSGNGGSLKYNNYLRTRKIGADEGYNDYAMHQTFWKNTSGTQDIWIGYIAQSITPYDLSFFDSSSINRDNRLQLISWEYANTNAGAAVDIQRVLLNGVQWSSYNYSTLAAESIFKGLTLGNSWNWATNPATPYSYGFDGYVHELMVYETGSQENLRDVMKYIGKKYGLANATGSIFPYKDDVLRWFKADEGVTTDGTIGGNGAVTAWQDFGSSGNNALAPASYLADHVNPQLISGEINGKDVILFGSESGEFQSYLEYECADSPGPNDPHTICVLYQPGTVGIYNKPKSAWPVTTTYQGTPLIEETNTNDQLLNIKTIGATYANHIPGNDIRASESIYWYSNNQEYTETVVGTQWQFAVVGNSAQGNYGWDAYIEAGSGSGADPNTSILPTAMFRRYQSDPYDGTTGGLPFPANASNDQYRHGGIQNGALQSTPDYRGGGASWNTGSSGLDVAKGRIGRSIWDENPEYYNNHAKVAEIIVWKKALTISEIQQVAEYMSQKWGLNFG